MQPSKPKEYKPGRAVAVGLILGTFAGIVLHKLALGIICGLIIGLAVDARKRKTASDSTLDGNDG